MRSCVVLMFAVALMPAAALAEIRTVPLPPTAHRPTHVAAVDHATPAARPGELTSAVTLADIGFVNGLRLSNLGGHQELFVP
ncbi:MAG: hypothetical protein KGI48_14385, partial [Hyphomicrobiales bacterium]|nr:hypothetical protein [Hyphomicrobiales bacterium]